MKNYLVLILLLAINSLSNAQIEKSNTEASTFYFIRHAEKDRSDNKNKNPNLTQQGVLRAAKWSLVLQETNFDAVYSTNYNRTKQTAKPTAEKNGLMLTIYNPMKLDVANFLNINRGKKILVVGHSNTTPAMVNAIIGTDKYSQIEDRNNSNLYIISISPSGELSDFMLVVD